MKKTFILLSIIFLLSVAQVSFAQGIFGNESSTSNVTISQTTLTPGGGAFFCQFNSANTTISSFFDYGTCLVGKGILPFLFLLATAVFMWGVVQYVVNADEEAKRQKGKQFMLWGIIALTVMVSIWGLVSILTTTFSLQSGAPAIQTPQ